MVDVCYQCLSEAYLFWRQGEEREREREEGGGAREREKGGGRGHTTGLDLFFKAFSIS